MSGWLARESSYVASVSRRVSILITPRASGGRSARSSKSSRSTQPVIRQDAGGILFVDTQGLLLRVRVHSAKIMDRDGITLLLEQGTALFPRPRHLWLDAGYNGAGKGKDWVETTLGWTAEIVRYPPKIRHVWAPKDAVIDWEKLLPPPGFRVLPKR